MKQGKILLLGKAFCLGLLLLFALLLLCAEGIERGRCSMDYARALILCTLLSASAVGCYYCAAKSGSGRDGLAVFLGGVLLLLLCALTANGRACLNWRLLLSIVVMLLGTILGNFLGLHHYYRLRPRRKPRLKSTK